MLAPPASPAVTPTGHPSDVYRRVQAMRDGWDNPTIANDVTAQVARHLLDDVLEILSAETATETEPASAGALIEPVVQMPAIDLEQRHADFRIEQEIILDPVCGMTLQVDESWGSGLVRRRQGKNYFFCDDTCKQKFEADPKRYLTV